MILLWPLALAVAGAVAWSRRGAASGRGWPGYAGWTLAGFLMSLSLVTGFSIGLFILPFAAALLVGVAYRAPHLLESLGLLAGIGITAVLVLIVSA